MASMVRRSVAEAVGTFALVFVGCGSVVERTASGASAGLIGVALAHGLVLSIMITAVMAISGGHLNPAVTVGLLVARRASWRTATAYIVAQLLGAVLGALAVKLLLPSPAVHAALAGTPTLARNVSLVQGIAIEGCLTFLLVSAVFGTCVNPLAPKLGGFPVGLALSFSILVGGPLTGAALNPARAFGPALVSGQWVAHAVYWIGPILGGVVAALLWDYVLLGREDTRQ